MEEIIRMQENLLLIRRTVGWTAEEFGERIGVTRQTINNIESGRNKLTKTQYIAMRSVLDAEIIQAPEDKEVLVRHEAIIKALKDESDATKERLDYLQSLNILLQQALKDLSHDLGVA